MSSHGDRPLGIARLLKWMGVLLIVLGLFARRFVRHLIHGQPYEDLFNWRGTLAHLLLIALGVFLFYRGRQYAARALAPRVLGDARPPVVYLRPFAHDESMVRQVFTSPLSWERLLAGLFSTEEQLAEAVAPLGPLIAIGQPGEPLPKPGAARAYVSEAEWKDVVDRWLSKARLVIIQPGQGEGVWWEMERIFTTVQPERVLVLLLKVKRASYESFAESVQARFGIVLPCFNALWRLRAASGFLEFSDGWNARFLPLLPPLPWRMSLYKRMRRVFHHTLRPVFSRLGVDWRPSRISILMILIGIVSPFTILLLVSMVLTVVQAVTGQYEAGSGSQGSEPQEEASLNQAPPETPPAEWSSSAVAGLHISAPGTFESVHGRELQHLRERLHGMERELEYYELETETLFVYVTRITVQPGARFHIDTAVRGQIHSLARQDGYVRHSIRETQVEGHRALRVSVWFTRHHQDLRYEGLTFSVGQTLWLVISAGPDTPEAGENLERILDSVRPMEARF